MIVGTHTYGMYWHMYITYPIFFLPYPTCPSSYCEVQKQSKVFTLKVTSSHRLELEPIYTAGGNVN